MIKIKEISEISVPVLKMEIKQLLKMHSFE